VKLVREALTPETVEQGENFERMGLGRMGTDQAGRPVWVPAALLAEVATP
jgi:hypothetical protein